ncbi:MAG: hypothetical protein KAV87_11210 [Desulfobacteraceae bacterium]|nr:hypothetical protein [Desulfobacteraceae bacterium]
MILEWVRGQETVLWLIGILSMVTLLGTLIVIPIIVIHIPANYFSRERQDRSGYHRRYSLIRLPGLVLKNILGIVFVVAGFAMLLLPGQGFITILIGIMLLNFPGKHALEQRIVRQPTVLRAINWMRAKANKAALQVPKPALTAAGRERKTNFPLSRRK